MFAYQIMENIGNEGLEKLYKEYKTLQALSKELKIDLETIRQFFIKNNISYAKRQKYTCNENFFSDHTEKSFYWAGFIAADGNIEKKRNRLKIELKLSDSNHLEKFKSDIELTSDISTHENKESRPQFLKTVYWSCSIRLSSAKVINDLKAFNIVPNKSKIYEIPDWVLAHPL